MEYEATADVRIIVQADSEEEALQRQRAGGREGGTRDALGRDEECCLRGRR